MNVTVRPLMWKRVGRSETWFAETVCGTMSVYLDYRVDGGGTAWSWSGQFAGRGPDGDEFATADEAKLAVERWHTARVLDFLDPAGPETAAAFVTAYAQRGGEYDDKGVT